MTRSRLRDLGITVGDLPTGLNNAITDIPGVLVGHTTLSYDEPRIARTGVTVIVPRDGRIHEDNAFAAYHVLNGNGEMTGLPWIDETGLLGSPIAITNTNQVGVVRDALVATPSIAVWPVGSCLSWLRPTTASSTTSTRFTPRKSTCTRLSKRRLPDPSPRGTLAVARA